MVSTSNALASAAGCAVLARGGSAADAAVAVQAVLGLTVPEATGLGAGGLLLYYDAGRKTVQAYDGRETAPAAATGDYLRYIDAASERRRPAHARASGRAIGTGLPRLLEAVQRDHGRLAGTCSATPSRCPPTASPSAAAWPTPSLSTRPASSAIAPRRPTSSTPTARPRRSARGWPIPPMRTRCSGWRSSADAFYTGSIARDIVASIATTRAADGSPITPGKTTLADPPATGRASRAGVHHLPRILGLRRMPPGGITVASALGIWNTSTGTVLAGRHRWRRRTGV